MGLRLVRRRTLPDGRVEEYEPLLNADGYYVLADRAVDPQHNKAINQFYVKELAAVAARIRKGGVSLRMRGRIHKQPNLISSNEIEIENTDNPGGVASGVQGKATLEEDPFASFTEWTSEADEAAYADL